MNFKDPDFWLKLHLEEENFDDKVNYIVNESQENPSKIAKFNKEFKKLSKNFRTKCIHNQCDEIAINSHLLGQSYFLKKLMNEQGKLVERRVELDLFKLNTNNTSKFIQLGLKKCISTEAFCNKHDHGLFKLVDSEFEINMRNIILLSYRTIACESKVKEKMKFIIEKFLHPQNSKILLLGISSFEYGRLNNELISRHFYDIWKNNKSHNLTMKVLDIGKVDVYCSSIISTNNDELHQAAEDVYLMNGGDYKSLNDFRKSLPGFGTLFSDIVVHVLPFEDTTKVCILGENSNSKLINCYFNNFVNNPNLMLTDLLCRSEWFGMSVYFRQKNNHLENQVHDWWKNHAADFDLNNRPNFEYSFIEN